MAKDEGKGKRTKPRKSGERLKHAFEADKPAKNEKLIKPEGKSKDKFVDANKKKVASSKKLKKSANLSIDKFVEASEQAMENIEDLRLSLNVEDLMDPKVQERVVKLLKKGCAITDTKTGKRLMMKDSNGQHYHLNNPVGFNDGFEKHHVFNDDKSVKKDNVIFLCLGNCLNDYNNVQVAPHPNHKKKYSIYVKGPKSAGPPKSAEA